jgi:hypothetical protein
MDRWADAFHAHVHTRDTRTLLTLLRAGQQPYKAMSPVSAVSLAQMIWMVARPHLAPSQCQQSPQCHERHKRQRQIRWRTNKTSSLTGSPPPATCARRCNARPVGPIRRRGHRPAASAPAVVVAGGGVTPRVGDAGPVIRRTIWSQKRRRRRGHDDRGHSAPDVAHRTVHLLLSCARAQANDRNGWIADVRKPVHPG